MGDKCMPGFTLTLVFIKKKQTVKITVLKTVLSLFNKAELYPIPFTFQLGQIFIFTSLITPQNYIG